MHTDAVILAVIIRLQRRHDVVRVQNRILADPHQSPATESQQIGVGTEDHSEIAVERRNVTDGFGVFILQHAHAVRPAHDTRNGQERHQLLRHADRPGTGAASAMRSRKSLMDIDVHHIEADIAGAQTPDDRIEIRAVAVTEPADAVDQRMAMALGLREPRGIIVTRLYPGSPAGKAGIEPGDVIDSINGSPVRDRREYVNILRNQVPGAALTLGVLRGDKPEKIRVKPASFDDATALSLMQEIWGLRVREADGLMLVRETRRPGPTDFLRPGDVIAAIGGMRIRTTADLVNAFRRERLANQVLMQIVRDGRPYYARVLLQ